MRGIVVPAREEDFAADPVELFFDLAFVFAFSQLVGRLIADPTWGGVGRQALLFGLLWLPWTQFTWSANAISGNGRPIRILFLVATAISVPMAAAVGTALGQGGTAFAVSLSIILALALAMMTLNLERGSREFTSAVRYAVPNAIAMVVLIGGSFVDGDGRLAIWGGALGIVLVGTILAGRGDWIVRPGHFAERHALIIIVALGEVIVAIGVPVVQALDNGTGLPGSTIVGLVASGAFAGLLWWAYFDRPQHALEHYAEELPPAERGRFVRDVYTYAHAPLVAGIVLSAAALEEITLHPTDPLPYAFRLMLFGGLALTVVGVAAAVGRTFHVVARERVVAAAVLLVLVLVAETWDGVVLLVVVDAVLLATLVAEHHRIEHPVTVES
ncbi:MAG: low temperature requirement protein A [Acidimicrobiales bacterium]|jgi:low temperature requirement protein LtrA|nr:low temperature requirement protein A [Acidimicrobiales bacterium]